MSRKTKRITTNDYIRVLKYYKLEIPSSNATIKSRAEDILAQKLCKCIKKVDKRVGGNEKKAIAICSKGVFTRKGLSRGKFECKKKNRVTFKKR
jgi:hypothetical protein